MTKTTSIISLGLLTAASALFVMIALSRVSEADDRIESSARKSYVFEADIKDDATKTGSKKNVGTLTGNGPEGSDTVGTLPGVESVGKQLRVKGENPAEHSDQSIGLKVKTARLFHPDETATKTDVNRADEIVSLSGKAASPAQSQLTPEYARDVAGSNGLKTGITVAKTQGQKFDAHGGNSEDASITAQVKASLMAHSSAIATKAKVSTKDGIVTLIGVASSAAEKSLVTGLVKAIDGVTGVTNSMTIQTDVSKTNSVPRGPKRLTIVNN